MVKIKTGTAIAIAGSLIPMAGYIASKASVDTMVKAGYMTQATGLLANTTSAIGATSIALGAIRIGARLNYLEEKLNEELEED